MSIDSLYLLVYLLVILIVDYSGFQDGFTFVKFFGIKHPMFNHLIRCSLCATWWVTLGFVCFGLNPWFLLFPFVSSIVSMAIGLVMDYSRSLLQWFYNKIV